MIHSRLIGSGHCLPERVVLNAELSARLDTTDEWIRTRTGIDSRIHRKNQVQSICRISLDETPSKFRNNPSCLKKNC